MSQQCALAARRANRVLHNRLVKREDYLAVLALVWPHHEYIVWFWTPPFKKDVKVLEHIQKRATKPVEGPERMTYDEWLWTLGLSSLGKRRVRGNLFAL